MLKEVLSNPALVLWPCLALLLFFMVLCGAGMWVLRRGSRELYRSMAALPFVGAEAAEFKGHKGVSRE